MRKIFQYEFVLLLAAMLVSGCPLWIDLGPDELLTADDIPGTWYMNFNWCCDNSWAGEAYITFYEGGGLSNNQTSQDYCSKADNPTSSPIDSDSSGQSGTDYAGVAKSGWILYENENGDLVLEFSLGDATYRCLQPYKNATLNGSMWFNSVDVDGCFKLTKQ